MPRVSIPLEGRSPSNGVYLNPHEDTLKTGEPCLSRDPAFPWVQKMHCGHRAGVFVYYCQADPGEKTRGESQLQPVAEEPHGFGEEDDGHQDEDHGAAESCADKSRKGDDDADNGSGKHGPADGPKSSHHHHHKTED